MNGEIVVRAVRFTLRNGDKVERELYIFEGETLEQAFARQFGIQIAVDDELRRRLGLEADQ